MREIRQSGSEGGGRGRTGPPYPYYGGTLPHRWPGQALIFPHKPASCKASSPLRFPLCPGRSLRRQLVDVTEAAEGGGDVVHPL